MELVRAAAVEMKTTEAEVIRTAAEIGLEILQRIDYKVAKAVVDAADRKGPVTKEPTLPKSEAPAPVKGASSASTEERNRSHGVNEETPPLATSSSRPRATSARAKLRNMIEREKPKP